MEVSFREEIDALRLGAGETFHGEGILAITKALLQSGVAYVGGYQGAPVSHLLDVMVQARDYLVRARLDMDTQLIEIIPRLHHHIEQMRDWRSLIAPHIGHA